MCTCNPRIGEVELGGSRAKLFSENKEFGNILGYMRPCFINKSIIVNKVICLRMRKRKALCSGFF